MLIICTAGCDGEYSATPGDYFMARLDALIKCGECGAPMRQVTRECRYRAVRASGGA